MRTIIVILALTCGLGIPTASAQALGDAVRLARPDDTVFITDTDGRTVQGQLVSISPESIRLLTPAAVVIPADRVSRIEKVGDPIRDGFRRGAIAGALFGAVDAGARLDGKDWILVFPKIWTAAFEVGLFGMLFDWLHKSRTTLYRAPAAAVSITRLSAAGSHGLALSWRF